MNVAIIASVLLITTALAHAAEPPRAVAIDKITIAVDDLAAMKTFYGNTLGVDFHDAQMGDATLSSGRLGEAEILLCPKKLAGITATENTVQLRFVVADAKAAYQAALSSGGRSINEPSEQDGFVAAAVRDPDGNSLELAQRR